MRLQAIKLAGFKSFVDPTTVPFPNNLCAVVGPNGCGKSNIIDAVRWVMGEGSAKNLRGESMTDVIFNGASGRKPVGQASIELVFDNAAGRLTGEYAAYAEISIKRQVSRDGQSSYFLNSVKCRRKDITDIFLGVPGLILAIAIVGALGPGIINAMLALSLVWWPGYVRLVQAKTLSIKNDIYVQAAQSMGAKRLRIVFIHILPNCSSPIIVKASMDMGMSILGAASLGFLGLGAQPPEPEWGSMISIARNYLPDWWWYSFFPGLAIFLTVMGFNLLGDGLRDILDPQHRE